MSDAADMAHQIAHELKGPLMGIKGLTTTAGRLYDELSEDERKEFFALIDVEATRLARVAEQIATLLILEAGDLRYDIGQVAVADLVSDATHGRHRVNGSTTE